MHLTTATLLASLSAASARIVGIAAPATVAPGEPFTLTLLTENYVQSVSDISVAWGYTNTPFDLTLGSFPQSAYLGPDKSNTLENVTVSGTVPKELSGEAFKDGVTLTAGVFSLYGASSSVVVDGWEVNVKIGEETSEELVRSADSAWSANAQE